MVLTMDELEMIVTGANIAGYMEEQNIIAVSDDTELTQFLVNTMNRYEQIEKEEAWWDIPAWHEYVESVLRQEYGEK